MFSEAGDPGLEANSVSWRALLASVCAFGAIAALACGQVPTFTLPPFGAIAAPGGTVGLRVEAAGGATFQWLRDGEAIPGATRDELFLYNFHPADSGVYSVRASNAFGSVESEGVIVGLLNAHKLVGEAIEVGPNITHPNGGIYDQVLLTGAAASITADPGQVTRISYVDLSDDIVQVEFSGAGMLSLVLRSFSGPSAPVKYAQADVAYMRGHASIVITGADHTTHVAVFTVGKVTALNQALFPAGVNYDGVADLSRISIAAQEFGGIRASNVSFTDVSGLTGVFAPEVAVQGPVFVGQIAASAEAQPVLVVGSATDVRMTGGDMLQANGRAVRVNGFGELLSSDGTTSHGELLPAQNIVARLERNGADVTTTLLDAIPTPLKLVNPTYPYLMRLLGYSGEVLVDFVVDTDGRVQNAFAQSWTRIEFVAPSVDAVSQWTFKPGRRSGRRVNTHMQVPIVYQLSG